MASGLHLFVLSFQCLLFLSPFPLAASCSSQNFTRLLCHSHERSALLQFKESLVINTSASLYPSDYSKVASWKLGGERSDCCLWDGVKCDEKTGHVIGLNLHSSSLYGSINSSSSLFRLRHLRRLDLADNNFDYSEIPSAIGNLSRLSHLDLSSSCFYGQVPSEMLELSKLVSLDLSDNALLELQKPGLRNLSEKLPNLYGLGLGNVKISSEVPRSLANLSSLSSLRLDSCNLNGEFPAGIFKLPNLRSLRVWDNPDLTVYLPELWGGNHLEELVIDFTNFSGQIPNSIGNLSSLTTFGAAGCNLQYLPPSLGNLKNLASLSLFDNNLHDNIPPSFGNLTRLTKLDLQNSSLRGPIPSFILGLPNLEKLLLTDNHLEGNVELDSVFKSRKLLWLFLSDNNLSVNTHISANTTPPNLEWLDLVSCNLTEFPSFLRSQNELLILQLSSNKIEGLIPKWMSSVATRTLEYLDLSNNFLKGFEQPMPILPWTVLVSLDISNNTLQGALPIPQPFIMEYRVKTNRFTGEISPMICNLTSLTILDLSDNNLTGSLPQCLANSSHWLEVLQLKNNRFTGEISPVICNLTSLTTLDLSDNNFTGSLPQCLGNFSHSLEILQLQNNSFHGSIPQTYKSVCKLKMVDISQNRFTGKLSRSLANCTELEVLLLGDNHLNDTFPSWLGVLSELKVLILRSNLFHGAIVKAKTKSGFPSLQIIDLSSNAFTGEFPFEYLESWTAMKNMDKSRLEYMHANSLVQAPSISWYLTFNYSLVMTNKGMETNYGQILKFFSAVDLSSNKFEGGIPEVLGTLKELHLLNLSNNILTGHIPSSLGYMEQLECLDLSGNQLSGEIPVQLTQLNFLSVLNVSGNNLTGPIPTGKQFNTFERSSFEGNPGLCGQPLPKRCRNDAGAPPAPSNSDEEEGSGSAFNFGWKIVAIGYACGMVLGGVIGYVFATKKQEWLMKTFRIKQQRKRRRVEGRGRNQRT